MKNIARSDVESDAIAKHAKDGLYRCPGRRYSRQGVCCSTCQRVLPLTWLECREEYPVVWKDGDNQLWKLAYYEKIIEEPPRVLVYERVQEEGLDETPTWLYGWNLLPRNFCRATAAELWSSYVLSSMQGYAVDKSEVNL